MAQTARSTRTSTKETASKAKAKPVASSKVKAAKPAHLKAVKAEPAKEAKVASSAMLERPRSTPLPPPPMPKASTAVEPTKVEKPAREASSQHRPSGVVPKGYVPLVNIPPLPPPPKDLHVQVGDKVVHPAHGLGEILAIEQREIGGTKGEFFIIRILDNGMRVMVPRASAQSAGLRPVMSAKEADKVLDTMKAREVAVDLQPWSRRFRAYTEMIKSGSPHEVAKVLRDMYRLKFDKELSFGERRLLDQAKSLLLKELAAAKGLTEAALQSKVDEMFRN
jgi:CarD family transcriptional regulator